MASTSLKGPDEKCHLLLPARPSPRAAGVRARPGELRALGRGAAAARPRPRAGLALPPQPASRPRLPPALTSAPGTPCLPRQAVPRVRKEGRTDGRIQVLGRWTASSTRRRPPGGWGPLKVRLRSSEPPLHGSGLLHSAPSLDTAFRKTSRTDCTRLGAFLSGAFLSGALTVARGWVLGTFCTLNCFPYTAFSILCLYRDPRCYPVSQDHSTHCR